MTENAREETTADEHEKDCLPPLGRDTKEKASCCGPLMARMVACCKEMSKAEAPRDEEPEQPKE